MNNKNVLPRRQGDVLLIPSTIRGKRIENRPVAYGEVTGHSHRVVDIPNDLKLDFSETRFGPNVLVLENNPVNQEADAVLMRQQISETMEMYEDEKGVLTLKINQRAAIVHEEHMTQVIEPGVYEYIPEMEHDPWEGLRRVVD